MKKKVEIKKKKKVRKKALVNNIKIMIVVMTMNKVKVKLDGCTCQFFQKQPSRGVLRKSVLEICSILLGEYDFNKVAFSFIEIALRHGCSPVNLLYIFITPFPKITSEQLPLSFLTTLKN